MEAIVDIYREILNIVATTPRPMGWYGIAIRLENKGIPPGKNLMTTLRTLEDKGYLTHEDLAGYPHGIYRLSEIGKKYLDEGV